LTNNGPRQDPRPASRAASGPATTPFVLGADPNAPDFTRGRGGVARRCVEPAVLAAAKTLLQKLDSEQRGLDKSGQVETLGTFSTASDSTCSRRRKRKPRSTCRRSRASCATAMAATRSGKARCSPGGSWKPACRSFRCSRIRTSIRGSWDTHNKHVERVTKELMPPADQAFSALLDDLHIRGLLDEKRWWSGWASSAARHGLGVNFSNNTNNVGGRDHWLQLLLRWALAGGGVKGRARGSGRRMRSPCTRRSGRSTSASWPRPFFRHWGSTRGPQFKDIQGQLRFRLRRQPGGGSVLSRLRLRRPSCYTNVTRLVRHFCGAPPCRAPFSYSRLSCSRSPAVRRGAGRPSISWRSAFRPILVQHCYEWPRPPRNRTPAFALDTAAGQRKGGDGGPVIVPGQAR